MRAKNEQVCYWDSIYNSFHRYGYHKCSVKSQTVISYDGWINNNLGCDQIKLI